MLNNIFNIFLFLDFSNKFLRLEKTNFSSKNFNFKKNCFCKKNFFVVSKKKSSSSKISNIF
ncbi:hypothetical protein V7Z24_00375 [Candidatus Carsonella ruddii]|uniref:hypothetical protein n=1 Tax=Carsonella ruddii TaxID=114186 RepID=UPI003D8144A9